MKITNTIELLNILENLHKNPVDEITIKQEKYQYEIQFTGITNSIKDMYECWTYDGNSYHETTLNNIISCVQDIGFVEAIIE